MENTKILHSRRILFKKFLEEDKNKDLEVFDHKDYKYFEQEVENKEKYIEEIINNYKEKKDYNYWHLVKIGENESVGLAKLIAEEDYFYINILIAEKYQNRGYATEALNQLLSEFLTEERFKEVRLKVQKENKKMQEVVKKCHIGKYKEEKDYIYYKMTNLDYMKYFAIFGDIDI